VDRFEAMLERLKGYEMSPEERRAQHISFATGNLMLDRPHYDEWLIRTMVTKYYDSAHEKDGD
jgi:hypothetical protein